MTKDRRTPKKLTLKPAQPDRAGARLERAEVRIILLVLASLLLGAAVGAYWAYRPPLASPAGPEDKSLNQTGALSESSKAVLSRLASPVEIRFYSVLDPARSADSLRGFAGRVEQLLAVFQREANGKLTVTHSNSQAYANLKAAQGDGIKPFDEDKGEPSYLGIAVINKEQKTSLPQLSPEWEAALEYDIARAILSTINIDAPVSASLAMAPKVDSNSMEEIKRLIPNVESVSLTEATSILREASFKEFAAAANQFQTQLSEAQERLKAAQNGGSEADQQAAIKDLQHVQTEQAARLKEIAAKSQAQVDALKQLKARAQ
jgi:hypothetical protein